MRSSDSPFVIDVGVPFQPCIDRNQVVSAVDLDAVAGVIDDGDIGIAGAVGKVTQRAPYVGAERSRRESTTSKPASFSVDAPWQFVSRIGERCDILVSGITQHQRHALLGKGRPADQQGCGRCQHPSKQS